jgi:hypothetical protein
MVTHFCIECGKPLIAGARFCGNCGLEAGNHAESIVNPSVPIAKLEICPKCGRADEVAKVSGIVSNGSRQHVHRRRNHIDSDYHSGTIVTSTGSVSRLKLSEPYKYKPFSIVIKVLGFIIIFPIPLYFVGTAAALSGDFTFFRFVFPVIVAFGAIVATIMIAYYVIRGPGLRAKAISEAKCWPKRKSGWDKLYYCYRDDLIFVNGRSAPASRMLEFLDGM